MNRILSLGCLVTAAGFGVGLSCQALGFRWWGFAMCVAEVLAVVGWWAAGRRQERAVRLRPDYARIALLEQELLGIKPEPGTFLAATEVLTEAFTPRSIRRDRSATYLAMPTMAGVRPSEMREILAEMGNPVPHPTEREIDDFIFRKAQQQKCPHEATIAIGTLAQPWRQLCTDCRLTFDAKPVPPPGPGAGSPVAGAVEQHRRAMANLREIRAVVDAQRADFEARRAEFDRIKAQMLPPVAEPPKP